MTAAHSDNYTGHIFARPIATYGGDGGGGFLVLFFSSLAVILGMFAIDSALALFCLLFLFLSGG